MPLGTPASQRVYNALFPYYAEVCVVTQYHRKGATAGGWGGHAALFVNGAELESNSSYPRLRLVADETDLSAPDSGIGVSVNRIFKNVTWVAVPGRARFFRGGLGDDRTLDETFYENAIRDAAAAGWFRGISIGPDVMRERPATMSVQEFIVRNSIGTDFALSFARTAYCARLPLSREAIGEVIAYLNAANKSAQKSGYTWNAYTNNCSHVAHNALAAAGVWDAKEARGSGVIDLAKDLVSVAKGVTVRRMTDFSFPANNFVRLYEAGNRRPIDDALAAFRDHDVVRTLDQGWISTGPGALIVSSPMHDAARNQLFARGRDPFLFSVPMLWNKNSEFEELTRRTPAILTDLDANLAHFRDRYAKTLASQRGVNDEARSVGGEQHQRAFRTFYDRFYAHITEALHRTDARLAEYRALAV